MVDSQKTECRENDEKVDHAEDESRRHGIQRVAHLTARTQTAEHEKDKPGRRRDLEKGEELSGEQAQRPGNLEPADQHAPTRQLVAVKLHLQLRGAQTGDPVEEESGHGDGFEKNSKGGHADFS